MSLYLLTYDLKRPGQDYKELIEAIKKYDSLRIMQSVWLISAERSRHDLFIEIHSFLDQNDEMLIYAITDDPAAALEERKLDWMRRKL